METLRPAVPPFSVLLQSGLMPVLAYLPDNSPEYATASREAEADAVVLSIGRQDTTFPALASGFELNESHIESVLSTLSIPTGICIGDARPLTRESWEKIVARPFSFVNMFAHHMPTFVLEDRRIDKIVSVGPGYMLEQVKAISQLEQVSAVEVALLTGQAKTHSFNLLDLATIGLLAKVSARPIFLRAQRRMGADDFVSLRATGIKGITVDPSALEPGLEAYRDAIRAFRQWGMNPERRTQ